MNHKLVPISHKLKSGDQVELLTSKGSRPKEEWLGYVTTAKAKSKVEYALRKQRREQIEKGEEIFVKNFEDAGVELTPSILDKIVDYYQRPNKDELFYAIGNGEIDLPQKVERLVNLKNKSSDNILMRYMKQAFKAVKKKEDKKIEYEPIDTKKTYQLTADSFRKNFSIATCCNPLPGDKVFGYVKEGNYVDVHNIHCSVGVKLKASHGDHIVNLEWAKNEHIPFTSTIFITGIDRMGMLQEISGVISECSLNIKEIKIRTEGGIFEGQIVLDIPDVKEANKVSKKLQQVKGVKSVNRVQNNS